MPSGNTAPTKTGYTFGGYYTQENGGGTQYYNGSMASTRAWDIANNATLYAKWTAKTYTVSFNVNGGSGSGYQTANVTATYDAAMPTISTTAPTKTGYTFDGWYDTSAATGGTQYYTAAGASAKTWDKTSNTTLYARWNINSYTLTINPNGGTWNSKTASTTVTQNYNTTYNVLNNATRTGYIFAGWKLTAGDGTVNYLTNSTVLKQYIINSTSAAVPGVYNNKGNGTVTHTIISDSTSSTGYSLKIVTNGEATPGAGGFVNNNTQDSSIAAKYNYRNLH